MKCDLLSREFWKYFLAAIGTISSVVTLVSFVFQLTKPGFWVITIYFILLLFSF